MTYYAYGIESIVIDAERVGVERLVAAWRARGDIDREESAKACTKLTEERDTVAGRLTDEIAAHEATRRALGTHITHERLKAREDRDRLVKERDDARALLDARTRERDTASECLRELSEERRSWQTSEREAHASRDRIGRELTETTRERDAERKTVAFLSRRLELAGDDVSVADIDTDTVHKSLWRVSRTDVAGKPGEYGNVIVWAADAGDAIDVVLWNGYNGGPMYGYRDRDHTVAVPLSYRDAGEADDHVVVAETLR